MEEEELIGLRVFQVEDAGCFWGCELPGENLSEEADMYRELHEQIQNHFTDTVHVVGRVTNPRNGEIYIGKHPTTKDWHRVQVQNSFGSSRAVTMTSCFLVDTAEVINIDARMLREAPECFLRPRHQARLFTLYGIEPLTMETDLETMSAGWKTTDKWDEAATSCVKKYLSQADSLKAQVMQVDRRSQRVYIRLYLIKKDGTRLCLNDDLVQNKYAAPVAEVRRAQLTSPSSEVCRTQLASPSGEVSRTQMASPGYDVSPRQLASPGSEVSRMQMTSPGGGISRTHMTSPGGGISGTMAVSEVSRRQRSPINEINRMQRSPISEINRMQRSPINEINRVQKSQISEIYRTQRSPVSEINRIQRSPVSESSRVQKSPISEINRTQRSPVSEINKPQMTAPTEVGFSQASRPSQNPSPVSSKGRGMLLRKYEEVLRAGNRASPTGDPANVLGTLGTPSPSLSSQQGGRPGAPSPAIASGVAKNAPYLSSDHWAKEPGSVEGTQPPEGIAYSTNTELSPGKRGKGGGLPLGSRDSGQQPVTHGRRQSGHNSAKEVTSSSGEDSAIRRQSSIRFSDVDTVFSPSKPVSTPSPKGRPQKSILKNSPSDPEDFVLKEATESRSRRASSPRSGGKDDDTMPETFVPQGTYDGTSLLEQLSGGHGAMHSSRYAITPDAENVYCSKPASTAITSFTQVPFGDLMRRVLTEKQAAGPTKIQTFAWRPIQNGRDVIGVAPRREGKSLAYVVPLISQLVESRNDYSKLPSGGGPKVLILSSSWRPASEVYDMACRASKCGKRQVVVKVIYGGDSDDVHEIDVVNGCDVLVATPHCLIRLLDKKSVNLKRLCHLVLDDGDILCETFTKPINTIMVRFREQKNQDIASPNQILAFANTWTPALGVFGRIHMNNPTVIITSMTEAAIFGKVRMEPVVCESNQRVEEVIQRCDSTFARSGKTVVVAGSVAHAETLAQHMQTASLYVKVLHERMIEELHRTEKEWRAPHDKQSPLILVVTDEVLDELSITDATTVIHFDPPIKKAIGPKGKKVWTMGRRLWCMRDYFANPVEKKEGTSQCVSYVLITSAMGDEAKDTCQMLQRAYAAVPPLLKALADRALESVEKGKSMELCHNLKAFGKCRDETRCRMRHMVFDSLDGSGSMPHFQKLPTDGVVKVLITHVKSASFFYGRLLEHQSKGGKCVNYSAAHARLFLELSCAMANPEKRQKCFIPKLDRLYAVEDLQHSFHRVRTVALSEPGSMGVSEKALVLYIDMGKREEIDTDRLWELPDELRSVPYQAVELYVCRVKPLDNDLAWTGKAEAFMSNLIFSKELHGHVVLSLGNCLWLDPLVERVKLSEVNTVQNNFNVKMELVDRGFGEANNTHVYELYELCKDRIELPEMANPAHSSCKAYTICGMPFVPEVCTLRMRTEDKQSDTWEDTDDWQLAYLSAVASPNLIYLQLVSSAKKLEEILDEVNMHLRYNIDDCMSMPQLRPGTLVLAKYPFEDNLWHRAKIMDVGADVDEVDIFFVDTGEQEYVKRSELRPMRSHFLNTPFQAIECHLMHVEPLEKGGDWPEEVSDFIWQFTRVSEDVAKPLYVKVVAKGTARCTGQYKYGVELYAGKTADDSCQEYGIDLAELLIARGDAMVTSDRLAEQFHVGLTEGVTAEYRKIPTMCSVIVRQESLRKTMASQVLEVVRSTVLGGVTAAVDMAERGLLLCLVDVISYVWHVDVVEPLCKALHLIVSVAHSAMTVTCTLRCTNQLCAMLDLCPDPAVQRVLIRTLPSLARSSQIAHSSILQRGGVRILAKVVLSSQDLKLKEMALDCLGDVVSDLQSSDICYITRNACIPVLCQCLQSNDTAEAYRGSPVIRCALLCLEKLAAHSALKDAIRKHDGIRLLCAVLNAQDQKPSIHEGCVRCLKLLASNNRFNKNIMHELKLTDILKRILKTGHLDGGALQLCHDLLDRLLETRQSDSSTPRPNPDLSYTINGINSRRSGTELTNQPLSKERISEYEMPLSRASPDVKWTQGKWNLLLLVDVRGVVCGEDVLTVSGGEVRFRAVSHSVEYTFHFTLYDLIVEEHSEIEIKNSQVLIGLRKKTKGRWPRLLKTKNRPPYLHVDHDRFVDSSSDTDSEEETVPEIPRPLSLAKRNVHRRTPFTTPGRQGSPLIGGNPEDTDESSDGQSDADDCDDVRLDEDHDYFHL